MLSDANALPAARRPRGSGWARLLACLLVVAIYLALTDWQPEPHLSDDYYPLQADAFLHGRTTLAKSGAEAFAGLEHPYDPAQNGRLRAQYRVHDLTLYHGRFYLYFGPGPALVLFAPFQAVCGLPLSQEAGGLVFCLGAFAALVDIHRTWRRRLADVVGPGTIFLETLALGLASFVPLLLVRMYVYEVAIAAGLCFQAAMLALWLRATEQAGGRRLALLGLAGLCGGLAVACRPNLLLGCGVLLLLAWWCAAEGRPSFRRWLLEAFGFAVPLGLCLAGLLAYNQARFDHPLDFGQMHQLAGRSLEGEAGRALYSLSQVPTNLKIFYLRAPHVSAYFPYLKTPAAPLRPHSTSYGESEGAVGVLWIAPLICLGLTVVAGWCTRWRKKTALLSLPAALLLLALANSAIALAMAGTAVRYTVDFLPWLLLGVILHRALVRTRPAWYLRGYGLLCLASCLAGLLYALQYQSLLSHRHPAADEFLFRTLNRPAAAWEYLQHRKFGAIEIDLVPARHQEGSRVSGLCYCAGEPYYDATDGEYAKCGFVLAQSPTGSFRIGYVVTGREPIWSQPFTSAPDTPLHLKLTFGSLYPPLRHAYWDQNREALRRKLSRVRVEADGRCLLDEQHPPLRLPAPYVAWDFPAPWLEYPAFDGRILAWRYADGGD